MGKAGNTAILFLIAANTTGGVYLKTILFVATTLFFVVELYQFLNEQ